MKKLFLLSASLVLTALAQTTQAQVRFGVVAGGNASNQIDHYQGYSTTNQLKEGFHVGGLADICLAKNFTLQPGLMYIMKGGKQQKETTQLMAEGRYEWQTEDKMTLHYLELPLQFTYRVPAGSGAVVFGAGGYASVLMSGITKYKTKTKLNGEDVPGSTMDGKESLEIGGDVGKDEIRPFDAGLVGTIGYEFANGLFLRGGVDAGLVNVVTGSTPPRYSNILPATAYNDATAKNMTYMISLGYWFGGK